MTASFNGLNQIIAIDAGNNEVKVCYGSKLDKFCSAISDWHKRPQQEQHGSDDMEWEYQGMKGFGGTLAKIESEFGSHMYGGSKNHFDATMRILLAIHRNTNEKELYLAVGNPYDTLTKEEATDIKKALIRTHELIVNGLLKKFTIKDVIVAAEGAAAFQAIPYTSDLVRIIDVGSGTVNLISILRGRIVDIESFTTDYGMLTSKYGEANPFAIARGIIGDTSKKWKKEDKVKVVGGPAEIIAPFIKNHYKNTEIITPQIWTHDGIKFAPPIFGNVVGMYNMAVKKFSDLVQV
ncbi:ParM/StbA family protein [Gottfriedia sp. NPDC057948]|uniref:ParM/StbA family protein n=1 Tax=Gottfriedia sp. NPDC057948 TaxID=3346287 RepID=UPI0036DC647C